MPVRIAASADHGPVEKIVSAAQHDIEGMTDEAAYVGRFEIIIGKTRNDAARSPDPERDEAGSNKPTLQERRNRCILLPSLLQPSIWQCFDC